MNIYSLKLLKGFLHITMDASEKTEYLNQISSQDVAFNDANNVPPKQGKVQVCYDTKLNILQT